MAKKKAASSKQTRVKAAAADDQTVRDKARATAQPPAAPKAAASATAAVPARAPFRRPQTLNFAGVGRNDICPCGSGKRFKNCHGH